MNCTCKYCKHDFEGRPWQNTCPADECQRARNRENVARHNERVEASRAYRFRPLGFLFGDRPPLEDPASAFDLMALEWDGEGLLRELEFGNLIPGLVIGCVGGSAGVVVSDPAGGQMVKPLWEALR